MVEQLVLTIAPLVLTNAAELRTVLGVLFLTGFMAKGKSLPEAILQAGRDYNERAQELSRAKADDAEQQDLGPPYVYAFVAVVAVAVNVEGLEQKDKEELQSLKEEINALHGPTEVDGHVKYCRAKVVKKQQAKDEDRVRVQLAFGEKLARGAESALLTAFELQGARWKPGPAPRGPLERQAAQLLDKVKKMQG